MSTRRYHLGLDWGTSSTKMVLRDYEGPGETYGHALVLEPEGRGIRYPSTVSWEHGHLYFGWMAEQRRGMHKARVWDSLKAAAAVQNGWMNPSGLEGVQLVDLVVLSLAHAISVALKYAKDHAQARNSTPLLGLSVGVPEGELQVRSVEYLEAAALGYRLAVRVGFDPQNKSVAECLAMLHGARHAVLPGLNREQENKNLWLRAEVAAAMMWVYFSPTVGEGPYTVVDIGAATTSASFFRIHGETEDGIYTPKAELSFFGAASQAPGMDRYGGVLTSILGTSKDHVQIRGQECALSRKYYHHHRLVKIAEDIVGIWGKARRSAWLRGPSLQQWEGLRYLVVGGGSTVAQLADKFKTPPGYFRTKLKDFQKLKGPGAPRDLMTYSASPAAWALKPYEGPHTFLLVAYGLSFHTADLPRISLPGQVMPFVQVLPTRNALSPDDLGYAQR
jgi:hypothetical protein